MTSATGRGRAKGRATAPKPKAKRAHPLPEPPVVPESDYDDRIPESDYDDTIPGSLFVEDALPAADEIEGVVDDAAGIDGDEEARVIAEPAVTSRPRR